MLAGWMRRGPLIGAGDQRLTVRSLKLVADGALGSRGAWLIEPYTDRPGHIGLPTLPIADIIDISHLAYRNGFQVAVHAIGDRANREVLDVFDALFDGRDRGVRYRVEHAQHIDPVDIPRFAQLGIIPSVQGIHMSSDRPWAIDRLGQKRIEQGAYMWRDLIDTGAILVNGTDVPVEPVNPFASFYALVTRQTLAGDPEGGFEPGQKISRAEALRAYTLNAAYAAFEEQEKGSLSPGKLADFVVLDRDIMTIPADEILATRVLTTYVSGEVVYQYPQTEALVKVER
jgi:predicted amidohydrolase YtcJ